MRVAIFGGSFNPVHAAHQLVALYVLETEDVDALWLVPTFAHPFGKTLASYDDRVAMCELAAAALGPRVSVSRAEEALARQPGFVASRTLDLLESLPADVEPRLVIGADILAETKKWYRWDEVARRAPPIVVGRGGYGELPGCGVTMPEISATHVRDLLSRRDVLASDPQAAVAGLVPRAVLRYIDSHGLYR